LLARKKHVVPAGVQRPNVFRLSGSRGAAIDGQARLVAILRFYSQAWDAWFEVEQFSSRIALCCELELRIANRGAQMLNLE
jgi:hypothetical protein